MSVNELNWYSNRTLISSSPQSSSENHYTSLFNNNNFSLIDSNNNKFSNNITSFNGEIVENKDVLTFSPTVSIIIAIIAAIMSLGTIIGNVFVITAFIIEKSLRKYSNYFILNLSIADLLIGLLIPPYAPFLLYNHHWKIGRVACTIWLVFDYVVGSASVLCIVVISLDRYLMVSRGLNYMANQKISKAICIMLTVWIIAFLNYAPAILFWEMISGKSTVKDGECQVEFHDNLAYLTATACVEFFVPFISICILNLAVYLNIRKRSRGLIRSENPKFKLSARLKNDNSNNKNNQTTINKVDETKNQQTSFQAKIKIKIENETMTQINNRNNSLQLSSSNRLNEASIIDDDLDNGRSNASSYSASSCDEEESSADVKSTGNTNRRRRSSSNRLHSTSNLDFPILNSQSNMSNILNSNNNANNNFHSEKKNLLCQRNDSLIAKNNDINNNGAFVVTTMTKSLKSRTSVKRSHKKPSNIRKSKKDHAKSKLKKDKKAARALFIFVFVFFICWV